MTTDDTFAIAMDCPHATTPDVFVRVWIRDDQGEHAPANAREAVWGEPGGFWLWIPSLDTWTLDTVRMVLHELSAYVPPDPDAQAGVTAKYATPRGRRSATRTSRLRIDDAVAFWVSARGWHVSIVTNRNERQRKDANGQWTWGNYPTGEWSEPMVSTLIDLADKSPLPLRSITRVLPGDPVELQLKYSPRLTVQLGRDEPGETGANAFDDINRIVRGIRKRLDDILDGDQE